MIFRKTLVLFSTMAMAAVIGCVAPEARESNPVPQAENTDNDSVSSPPNYSSATPPIPDMTVTECTYPPEWIGKPVDRKTIEAMSRPTRILRPGQPVTMDFSPMRLNIIIDDNDIVIEVKCG